MREGWNNCKLGELLEIKYGKDHKKLNDGKYPLYGSGGIMRYVDQYLYDDESILIPRKGTLTNLFYLNSPFSTVDTMFWSKINKEKVFPKFLYYLLKTYDFSTLDEGAAIPSLTTKTLKEVLVKIPESLETQRKIASILSGYDDLIENNLKRIKILEEMAQQTYEEWFVRMRFPGYETAVMNEETGLPEGWEKNVLKSFCTKITKGTTPTSLGEKFVEEGVKFIKAESYTDEGCFIEKKFAYIDEETHELLGRSKLERNDILVSIAGVLGRVAMVNEYILPANTNQAVGIVRINSELTSPYFIKYFLNSKRTNILINTVSGQAAQPNINLAQLGSLEILTPHKIIVEKFHDIIEVRDKLQIKLHRQNQSLREARDLLLPRLMMGILEV